MSVITTGAHPKSLMPGVRNWFGRAYDEYQPQYVELVDVETSDKAYEEEVESTGFGLATTKPQGDSITYDSDAQGYTSRYTPVVYGIGFIVTEEELEDNQYADVSRRRAPDLAFSLRQTKENVVANKYNRAFNSTYAGGDGKELLATDHPSLNGDWSNELATPADFAEQPLEDLLIQIGNAKNSRGMRIRLQAKSLIVPNQLRFEAHRVLMSNKQSGNANNDANAVKDMGIFTKGAAVNNYLTSDSSWFVRTNARHGLKLFQRRAVQLKTDEEFDTSNAKWKATERYAVGHTDPRALYGSAGV